MDSKFVHYTKEPFIFDPNRVYLKSDHFKPHGLWFSVEPGYGWKEWSEAESFALESLKHRTEVQLGSNILTLNSSLDIVDFSKKYKHHDPLFQRFGYIDWIRVTEQFDGIVIAPYQWSCRLHPDQDIFWYYSWDCASGCVWNLKEVSCQSE